MSEGLDFGFDRSDLATRDGRKGDVPCTKCGRQFHEHDKRRVSDGEGRYYYQYVCQ